MQMKKELFLFYFVRVAWPQGGPWHNPQVNTLVVMGACGSESRKVSNAHANWTGRLNIERTAKCTMRYHNERILIVRDESTKLKLLDIVLGVREHNEAETLAVFIKSYQHEVL